MSEFVREVTQTFPSGGEMLFRRSVAPETPVGHLAVIHGYGDHSGRYADFMRWIAGRGVACHGVDLRGQGHSTGRRGFVRRWDEYLADLTAFLEQPDLQPAARRGAPLFILGHSHGGLVVAAAVLRGLVKDVCGCILTSPFFRSRMVVPRRKRLLARVANPVMPWLQVKSGLSDSWMTADLAMREETRNDPLVTRIATPRWFLGQLRAQAEVMRRAAEFRLPVLVLAGEADPLADSIAAVEFYDRAGAVDKAVHVYPGLLHELLREAERKRVFEDIHRWVEARTPAPSARAGAIVPNEAAGLSPAPGTP